MSAYYPPLSCLRNYMIPRHALPYPSRSSTASDNSPRHPPRHNHHSLHSHHRLFHTSRPLHASPANPYEVLGLPTNCTQAEIKKQFYALSKAHHPDHNPDNQSSASQKFVAISDAYHQIGNPAARAKYDQENAPSRSRGGMGPDEGMGAPSGSGFGARRASGLSRRRTQFRGPPPSFYKNGGYGSAQTAQERAAAQEEFRAREEEAARNQSSWGSSSSASGDSNPFGNAPPGGSGGGAGYAGQSGSWPFQTDMNDVPHFDREGHFRTTSSIEDQLRQGRSKRRKQVQEARREEEFHEGSESAADVVGKFVLYGGTLAVGIAGSSWLMKATQ